jgi:uncharacterized membrane protein (Fun14 family)
MLKNCCSCDNLGCGLSLRGRKDMMIDQTQLISSAFPLVGGSAIGFGVGYVIKKLMKLAFIGLGLVMLVLGFLEYKHWISVNWTLTENQSSAILTHLANKIATVTQHMNHEIPIGVGVLGFMPGLALGLYKG